VHSLEFSFWPKLELLGADIVGEEGNARLPDFTGVSDDLELRFFLGK